MMNFRIKWSLALLMLTAVNGFFSSDFFCTVSVALPLLWSPKFLVFSLLSSHLLSLGVSRVKSFPITYRGISCTWTARWGTLLFLTSCFSHSLATVLLLQHRSNPSVLSVLQSVHLRQFCVCWMQMVSLKIAVHCWFIQVFSYSSLKWKKCSFVLFSLSILNGSLLCVCIVLFI